MRMGGIERGSTAPWRAHPTWLTLQQKKTHGQLCPHLRVQL